MSSTNHVGSHGISSVCIAALGRAEGLEFNFLEDIGLISTTGGRAPTGHHGGFAFVAGAGSFGQANGSGASAEGDCTLKLDDGKVVVLVVGVVAAVDDDAAAPNVSLAISLARNK